MANDNGRKPKASPAFQLYPRDLLSDGLWRGMTHEQRGAFMEMLCHCWQQEGLGEGEKHLARAADMPLGAFRKHWEEILSEAWELIDGRWWNPRMRREWESLNTFKGKCSTAGKASGEARRKKAAERKANEGGTKGERKLNDRSTKTNPSPSPSPSPVNPLPGVQGDRPPDSNLPKPLQHSPPGIQTSFKSWAGVVDGLLERELISIGASRVLLDVLELRCSSVESARGLKVPLVEGGWLDLGREIDKDLELSQRAFVLMRGDNIQKLSTALRMEREVVTKAEAEAVKAHNQPRKGTLDATRIAVRMSEERQARRTQNARPALPHTN